MAAAILQIRRGTNASTSSIVFSESELFYNQSKETLQISNGANTLITLARLDRINTGSLSLTGDFTASNALFTGDITFGGSLITLGNENTDNIVIGGELSSSIIPNNDNSFDLGSDTRKYRTIYAVSGSITNLNGVNFTNFVNSTNTFTSSQETKNSTLSSYTASINADLTNLHLYTSSIDSKFTTLGSYTSSIDAKFSTLSTYTSSINSDLSQLHTYTASVTADLTNLHTYTASINADLSQLHTYTASVNADLTQIHTYTASVSADLTNLHTYTASVNSDLSNLHTYTASVNSDLSNLHAYTSSINTKFTTLGSYTSSIDSKFTTLGAYTSSIDSKFTTLGTYTSSIDSKFVAVGSTTASLNAYTASQDTKNATLAIYTASVNSDLSNLHTYTASVNADLSQLHTYTSSLKSAIDVSGANLTIYGDLTVQGNTTTLNTSELIVEDKLLALASGSTTSAQADGAGLYISGANASMLWDNTNSNLVFNQKISSSVGFKGNGSEITGVTAASVDYYNVTNRPVGIVSGSTSNERIATLTQSLDYRYLNVDGDSVISGSSQIDATATTNWSTGIKTQLNNNTVISGSTQITNGSGLLSSSFTNFANYTQSIANDLNTIHSFTSSQETKNSTLATYTSSIDSKFTTLGTYTSSIDSKFTTLSTYTASINADLVNLHSYTASNDSNVTKLFGTASAYSAFSSSINTTIKTKMDTDGVVSSSNDSSTIDFSITNGVLTGNVIGGIVSGSSQVTQSLDGRYELSGSVAQLVGIRAVSGSLGSAAWYNVTSSGDIALVSGSITYNNNHLLTAGATKKYIDWRTDEILTAIGAADITSVNAGVGLSGGGTVGDVTLTLDTASAHFTNGVKTKLNTEGVISGSSQVSYLGLTNIPAGIVSSSTQIDALFNLDGVISSSAQIDALFNLDGIVSSSAQVTPLLPAGTVSGSSQILNGSSIVSGSSQVTASLDGRYELQGRGIISGSTQLSGTTIQNLSGSFTGSFKGNLAGVADYAQTVAVSSVGTTTDTTLYPTFTTNAIIGSYTGLYSHLSASFYYNGVTRKVYGEAFVGAIEATNGVVSGSSQIVSILDPLNTFSASQEAKDSTLSSVTASLLSSQTNLNAYTASQDSKNSTLSSVTASLLSSQTNLNAYTASQDSKNSTLSTYTSSNDTKWSTLGSLSGSFARINSANTFTGNQTITGSLFISQDLVVAGSSSIQNISSSNLVIGAAYVTLNTFTPSSRFAGLQIIDSGSAGLSGSLLYDAIDDEFVFVHKGNGTNVTSSHFLMGPETYDNLGNETYLTANKLPKGRGNEHLGDSNITDTGTLITLGSNSVVNGTFYATGTPLVSGSAQISGTGITNNTITIAGTSTALGGTISLATITNGSGIVSGSSQITAGSTTNFATDVKTQLNANTVVSGSSQITAGSTTNFATDVKTQLNANTVVSGSSQITLSSTTGGGTSANVQFGSLGIGMAASGTSGRIDATNDIVAYSSSDRRFKDNIKPIENALDKINQIGGYEFDWKEENKIEHGYEGHDLGVIAQEIEAIAPELVQTRENGYKAVKYDKLVSVLIQAIKELSAKVTELENK